MRKIKTKAELKGLAQVPHPSFTQVSCCPCMRVVLFAWVNCIKELKGKLKTKLLMGMLIYRVFFFFPPKF